MKINDEGRSNSAYWYERAMKAEARLQKIMARCADLLDEDQFNELDAMARAADPTPGGGASVEPSAATENPEAMYNPVARKSHAGASARQIDVAAGDPSALLYCEHLAALLVRSAETGEPLYCELCDDKSGRRDAEQREVDLQARLAEAEAENARLVAANKARDEFLRGHRYKHSEVDGYINLCESQIATLKARLAEADALIAKGLAVVHDFLPNIGRCVLQDYQRMNEFCSEAAARAAVSAVQPERCCVDYPRCDCNSPAEWPTREEAEKRAAELMAIGRATLSRSKHTPECSYWDGLMAQVCNCGATGHTSGSAL